MQLDVGIGLDDLALVTSADRRSPWSSTNLVQTGVPRHEEKVALSSGTIDSLLWPAEDTEPAWVYTRRHIT